MDTVTKVKNSTIITTEDKETDSERRGANRSIVSSIDNQDKKKNQIKISIIVISYVCLIAILIAVLHIVIKLLRKDNNSTKYYPINVNEYKKELSFKTKVDDIRRISIHQQINQNMIIDGIEIPTKFLRKTEYDIYSIYINSFSTILYKITFE